MFVTRGVGEDVCEEKNESRDRASIDYHCSWERCEILGEERRRQREGRTGADSLNLGIGKGDARVVDKVELVKGRDEKF